MRATNAAIETRHQPDVEARAEFSSVPTPATVADPTPNGREEARAFLQQRLAFLGKAETLLTFGFYTAGNLVGLFLSNAMWEGGRPGVHSKLLVPSSGALYLAAWLICRRGRLPEALLIAIDAALAIAMSVIVSFMVFARFSTEVLGLPYSRMLLIITFGFVIRAVIVPSSARRTLVLGLIASLPPVVTSQVWYRSLQDTTLPVLAHDIYTALWCLGAVSIATLASHVIFGLRRQVREAWQLGQYTLLEKIGEGGMGSVYRASHAMLRRPTAVKLLPPEKSGVEQLRRFEREVQLTSLLTHPSTVVVFDYGRTLDGIFYYAMEYLEGLNLEQLVRLDGAQPAGRVAHILRQVAGSLAEAHSIGLIHRDIKPANVILVPERGGVTDVAKVVDFGLAKDLDRQVDLSREDIIAGTPHYLSPEAVRAPDSVDARSDLYSLGCVGYYLLTGHKVFEGRTVVEVCSHHLHTTPIHPAERLGRALPATLTSLILDCLEKDPEHRPPTARAIVARLESLGDVPAWSDESSREWWTRRRTAITALHATVGSKGSPAQRTMAPSLAVGGPVSFVRPLDRARRLHEG